jgi:hypothetical protein
MTFLNTKFQKFPFNCFPSIPVTLNKRISQENGVTIYRIPVNYFQELQKDFWICKLSSILITDLIGDFLYLPTLFENVLY